MTYEEQLLKALKEKLLRQVNDQAFTGAPQINIHNAMPNSISEALNAGGSNSPGKQAQAAQMGMSPEELDYFVNIEKRDVMNPDGETVGWDKNVHRYTQSKTPKKKESSLW